jgi:hypothetical protein
MLFSTSHTNNKSDMKNQPYPDWMNFSLYSMGLIP